MSKAVAKQCMSEISAYFDAPANQSHPCPGASSLPESCSHLLFNTSTSQYQPLHHSYTTSAPANPSSSPTPSASITDCTKNKSYNPQTPTTMGLLDPFWNAVDTTIAGAGATVGGAIQGIGDGITQTGRNVGDSIAGAASGYGNYVNDSANYVRDATGAPGVRAGSASNPLGLTRNKEAAKMTGMPKYTAPNKGGQKTIAPPPPKTIGPSDKQRSLASTNAANLARAQAAKRREAAAAGQNKSGTVTGRPAAGATTPQAKKAGATPKTPAAKPPASAKKPTPATGKPAAPASQAQKKTGGTVTGRPAAGKAAAGMKK